MDSITVQADEGAARRLINCLDRNLQHFRVVFHILPVHGWRMNANVRTTIPAKNVDTRQGFIIALTTYLLWGFLPFYMKAVAHIPAAEVVAHRIVWSVPIAGAIILLVGKNDGNPPRAVVASHCRSCRAHRVDHHDQLGHLRLVHRGGPGA